MIRVRRSTVAIPAVFATQAIGAQKKRAQDFYSRPYEQRDQMTFDWIPLTQLLSQGQCMERLRELFHEKCAYCESLSGAGSLNLEFFRPRDGALGLDGSFSQDHYWWLAFDWSNFLPICALCYSAKAQRFPIRKARAPVGASGASLDAERPLLIDPCRIDPELHLVFTRTGSVSSDTPQGQCTIEVLALNREPLVKDRLVALDSLESLIDAVCSGSEKAIQHLHEDLSAGAPYLAAKRQLVRTRAKELHSVLSNRAWRELQVFGGYRKHSMNLGGVTKAETIFRRLLKSKQRHSVEDEGKAARRAYFSGVRRIERIEVSNFKQIRHLELIAAPASERESWLVLVGENSTGKSSLLQAIGLALLGKAHIEKLGLDARRFITRGEKAGYVKVHLTNVLDPVELHFSSTSKLFRVLSSKELVLLLGYGATRLLPRSSRKDQLPERYVRVKNLFDPYARLQHAERWLSDLDRLSDREFAQAGKALKKLLLLDDSDRVRRRGTKVFFEVQNQMFTLRQLSDGYQSMVALAVDIMMGLNTKWEHMDLAEGIILIDEIETHLHPIWKMEVVSRFRNVFPRVQFFVTTHDPLCLRGLCPGEIVVLKRGSQGPTAEIVTEDISHLRADQLLTSPIFGLISTREPEFQRSTDRYSELLGKSHRTLSEENELKKLRERMRSGLLKGETSLERSVEKVVHEVIRTKTEISSPNLTLEPTLSVEAKEAIKQKLVEVFG